MKPMSDDIFFDTNVVIYALSGDGSRAEIAKRSLAGGGVVSVQVMNEMTNIFRRKLRMSWEQIDQHVMTLRLFIPVVRPVELSTYIIGRVIAERHQLQFYDSLLLASALEAGCKRFVSEDMQNGMMIDSLRIVNPFTP
jgi:predicted nucleic acid-binding protein